MRGMRARAVCASAACAYVCVRSVWGCFSSTVTCVSATAGDSVSLFMEPRRAWLRRIKSLDAVPPAALETLRRLFMWCAFGSDLLV